MNKPSSFQDLPASLQERFLWECDLDYCGYESSKAETIHDILCNYPYAGSTNDRIISSSYKQLSAEKLEIWIRAEIDAAKHLVVVLENLLLTPAQPVV